MVTPPAGIHKMIIAAEMANGNGVQYSQGFIALIAQYCVSPGLQV